MISVINLSSMTLHSGVEVDAVFLAPDLRRDPVAGGIDFDEVLVGLEDTEDLRDHGLGLLRGPVLALATAHATDLALVRLLDVGRGDVLNVLHGLSIPFLE